MSRLLLFVAAGCFYLSTLVAASRDAKPEEFCVNACQYSLTALKFNGTDPDLGYYPSLCTNTLRIKSFYLCSKLRCKTGDIQPGIDFLNRDCLKHGGMKLPPLEIVDGFDEEAIDSLRRISLSERTSMDVLNEVILPADDLFSTAFATIDAWSYEMSLHINYGWALYLFWAAAILLSICYRSLEGFLSHPRYESLSNDEDTTPASRTSKFGLFFKRNFIIPATFGYRTAQPVGWCTLPARLQSLTVAAYVVLNLAFCCINYRIFEGNLYWSSSKEQLIRYISDRTGIISFANMPLMFLFATRNNFLLLITGWSFATFNSFHRWIARVATLQAVVHSVMYTYNVLLVGGMERYYGQLKKEYWYCGVLATTIMSLILGQSVYGVRRHFYDLFLFLHIVFSIVFLVGCYYHVKIFSGAYNLYIWPCVAVWAFDRATRVSRIIMLNYYCWNTRAEATYSAESDIIKLEVSAPDKFVRPFAGAYYYIYVFQGWRLWENHPFTLAGFVPARVHSPYSTTEYGTEGLIPLTSSSDDIVRVDSKDQAAQFLRSPDSAILTFLIRPYEGFTSRLKNDIISRCSSTVARTSYRVLLEGPYGESPPLERFEHVLFIVGGTGVASMLSHLARLLDEDYTTRQKIRIIWSLRSADFVTDVISHEIREAIDEKRITLEIYMTGSAAEAEANVDKAREALPESVAVLYQRPDVNEAVLEMAQELVGAERLAVVASGPAGMADDCRAACVRVLKKGHDVEYIQDSFTW